MSSNSRAVIQQSVMSKEKQVGKTRRVEEKEGRSEKENSVNVTRELQIKAISNGGGNMEMDKEVVLRRIRQRKRVNKFRAALQALLSSPFSKTTPDNSWLDDPFAAL